MDCILVYNYECWNKVFEFDDLKKYKNAILCLSITKNISIPLLIIPYSLLYLSLVIANINNINFYLYLIFFSYSIDVWWEMDLQHLMVNKFLKKKILIHSYWNEQYIILIINLLIKFQEWIEHAIQDYIYFTYLAEYKIFLWHDFLLYKFLFIFNFYCCVWEFSRVIRYGLSEVGHKNVSKSGKVIVLLFPIGCNKLFHKLFATKNK